MSRPFSILNVVQRSDEWRAGRLGRLTGSKAVDMLAKVSKGEASGRRNLRTQYVLERLTGIPQESSYFGADMKWGVEKEPEALAMYEAATGRMTRRYGFLQHDTLMAGFSPDAVIGDFEGLVECKAPKSGTHMQYLLTGKVPHDYLCQIRHGLWLTGAAYCDFISYDPRFPEDIKLFTSRVDAKSLDLPAYESEVRAFLAEIDAEQRAVLDIIQKRKAA